MNNTEVFNWGEWFIKHAPLIFLAIQNIVLIVTAIFAWLAIKSSKKEAIKNRLNDLDVAKKTASINHLKIVKSDPEFQNAITIINQLRKTKKQPNYLLKPSGNESDLKKNKRIVRLKACKKYLDELAMISVGISNEIFDEQIFRKNMYSTVLIYHEYLKPLINQYRLIAETNILDKEHIKGSTIFKEVDDLVSDWRNIGY